MARRGRKRKAGRREPSGRLRRKPKQVEERVRIARAQPHRRGLKSNDRPSELAESALGRLCLTRTISAGERAAGETFAAIVGKYRRVIEGPRIVRSLAIATSDDYGRTAENDQDPVVRFDCASEHADPIDQRLQLAGQTIVRRKWPCELSPEGCQCLQRKQRYTRAYEAIAAVGRNALMAVIRVAVRGEELRPGELVYLKAGLNAAKLHLGLTDLDRRA
jgi:hypothetical protein